MLHIPNLPLRVLCPHLVLGDPMYVANVRRDQAETISLLCLENATVGGNSVATLVFRCHGIDELYEEFQAKGVVIVEEIGDKAYGMREFRIKDPDGYLLYFQEPTAPQE